MYGLLKKLYLYFILYCVLFLPWPSPIGRAWSWPTPHKRVNFHRINPLEEWVAPAILVPRPCSQLNCHKRSGSSKKAIQVYWLFRRYLPEPPLFPCSSIDRTTIFCIASNSKVRVKLVPVSVVISSVSVPIVPVVPVVWPLE